LLLAGTVSYLAALPLQLGHQDEPHYLHEAKRLLGGERLYRDIFELTTPGWMYLMALLFRVFGGTLSPARIATAVIHAGTAALLFLVCRRLAVRRGLALACAMTYVMVSQLVWPVASQHWLATLVGVALLLLCLRPLGPGKSFGVGLVVGLAIAIHQTRGLGLGLGVAAFLVVDTTLLQRQRLSGGSALWSSGIAFVSGALLIVVPLLAGLVASAGFEPVWGALVVHPLENYRGNVGCRWGHGWSRRPIVQALKYVPLALLCTIPRLPGLGPRDGDSERVRRGILLMVFGLGSIASIWYYPDFIHIAFILPVFLVALADGVERLLRALPSRIETSVGWVVALAIVTATGRQLLDHLATLSAQWTTTYQSAFGPVALSTSSIAVYEELTRLLNTAPSRTLYCHPTSSYTYLLVDARNPTRFEFILPGSYNTPAQVDEVIRVLRTTEVPYVLLDPRPPRRHDPIRSFIPAHYEPVSDERLRKMGLQQTPSSPHFPEK